MNPGEVLETAMWASGLEQSQVIEHWREDAERVLRHHARRAGWDIEDVRVVEKRPGDERVPPVPDTVSGPNIRLVVVEATVCWLIPESRFTQELEPDDLAILRRITRRKYAEEFPHLAARNGPLSDAQADTLINDLGPEAAIDALERAPKDVLN